MIDPKLLREQPETVANGLARRGAPFDVSAYRTLDAKRKTLQVRSEKLRAERNRLSKEIGAAARQGGDVQPLKNQVAEAAKGLTEAENELKTVQEDLREIELGLPNLLDETVPDGADESANREIKVWGEPRAADDAVRDHVALGEALGQMDFAAAARVAGARFTVLFGDLARLHRALIQFMLDMHLNEHGYTEAYVPYIINAKSLLGTGNLPSSRKTCSPFSPNGRPTLCPQPKCP